MKNAMGNPMANELINGNLLAINELTPIRNKLNEIINSEKFESFYYFVYTLDFVIPLTCSSVITPSFSFDNTKLNQSSDPNDIYEPVFINVIPTETETNIVLSCFDFNKKSMKFISDLEKLNDSKLQNAISSIIISDIENTFISPDFFNKLSKEMKANLLKKLDFTGSFNYSLYPKFYNAKLNLFNERLSEE